MIRVPLWVQHAFSVRRNPGKEIGFSRGGNGQLKITSTAKQCAEKSV